MGVDGRIFPVSSSAAPRKQQEGELGLKERWYPIQVKQKDKAGRPDIDAFEAMMMREDCKKGFFVSFDYSSDALQEIESFFKRSHKVIVALTVRWRLGDPRCRSSVPIVTLHRTPGLIHAIARRAIFVDDNWWRRWCVWLNDNADAGADVWLIGEFPAQPAAEHPGQHQQRQPD